MERQSSPDSILAPAVLGDAFVHAGILLLEAGDLQDGVGVPQLHFAREWIPRCPPPADLWYWATSTSRSQLLQLTLTIQSVAISSEQCAISRLLRNTKIGTNPYCKRNAKPSRITVLAIHAYNRKLQTDQEENLVCRPL